MVPKVGSINAMLVLVRLSSTMITEERSRKRVTARCHRGYQPEEATPAIRGIIMSMYFPTWVG